MMLQVVSTELDSFVDSEWDDTRVMPGLLSNFARDFDTDDVATLLESC